MASEDTATVLISPRQPESKLNWKEDRCGKPAKPSGFGGLFFLGGSKIVGTPNHPSRYTILVLNTMVTWGN